MGLGKVLREFGVKIGLGFDKAAAEKANKEVTAMAKNMRSLAIEVSAAAAALGGMALISSRNSFALDTQSKQLGLTTTALQELEYAARVAAGVSREELGGALESLSKTMFEAQNNASEAGQAFVRLGVATTDELARGTLKADELLKRLAERFAKMPDGVAKTGLAASVGMERLLPLLNKGREGIAQLTGEAHELGVVLDESMIKKGVRFNQSLESIWTVLKNITYIVGGELITYLQPLAVEFQKWVVQNRKFIALGIAKAMRELGTYLTIVFKVVRALFGAVRTLVELMGGLEKVSRMVALAMGLFASFRLVSGVVTLIKNFKLIGVALGALLSPVGLISAALVALILIVQDLFADDSIIKEWLGAFKKEFPTAVRVMSGAFNTVKESVMGVYEAVSGIIAAFRELIKGTSSFGETATKVFSSFKTLAKATPLGRGISAAYEYLTGPSTQTAQPSVGATSNTTNAPTTNNMSATINVAVPPGMSAKQATEVVSSGVEDGFMSMLRNTRNQSIGGVAY